MKVLYVINGLGTGGAERSLAEMLPGLVASGVHPVVVCSYHRDEGVEESVRADGVDVRLLSSTRLLTRVAQLRRIVATERPDLIHTTLFEADVLGRLAGLGTRAPVLTSLVNTAYDPVRLGDPHVSLRALTAVRLVDGWTARHLTRRFHAITHAVKGAATRDLSIPAERITVIERGRSSARLGLPSQERRHRARQALGLAPDDEVVVTVGRQEYQKGHRYLLEAAGRLLRDRRRLVLLVAGRTGHATPDIQRLHAALPDPSRVHLLGHRDDVPEVLAAADLFVFPSLYEGLGGAVIEAMALGLPVIASRVPALTEIVEEGHNARLVPPASSDALAEALTAMLQDAHRARRFALRSRAIFEERFTLDRSVTRMIQLYGRTIDAPSSLRKAA